jgi:cytochrome c biogenesis factor
MRAFYFAIAGCVVMLISVCIVVFVTRREDFLTEKSEVWLIMSSFSILLSIATIIMAIKLMKYDP